MNLSLKKMALFRLLQIKCPRTNCCCRTVSSNPLQQDSLQKMKQFWEKETLHAANLNYQSLTDEEKLIHDLHNDAITKGHFTYHDPKTNERILTRLRHYLRGKCCGNACRHCVYNHDNVIDEYKLNVRRFNTSFWTYPDEEKRPIVDESCYFDGSNIKPKTDNRLSNTKFHFNKA